jgi:hypothetical protein
MGQVKYEQSYELPKCTPIKTHTHTHTVVSISPHKFSQPSSGRRALSQAVPEWWISYLQCAAHYLNVATFQLVVVWGIICCIKRYEVSVCIYIQIYMCGVCLIFLCYSMLFIGASHEHRANALR